MEHTSQHFERGLQRLREQLLRMGGLVEDRLQKAATALMDRREDLAAFVVGADGEVNELQIQIDELCLRLLALQHPVASDLRMVTSAIKINADLERMADQAVNIAQSTERLLRVPPLRPLLSTPRMFELAEGMVRDALDAFVRQDVNLAQQVLERDDEVDTLRDQSFRVLLTHMLADPSTIERALGLILIGRNLERVADHATNIAEDVIFIVEARDIRHARPGEAGR